MQYSITLQAGIEKRQQFSGRTLVLLTTGAADTIDLTVEVEGGFPAEELRGVRRGLKLQAPGFTGAKFLAAVNCTIEVIVSNANISVSYQDNANVTATIDASQLPLPVLVDDTIPLQVEDIRGDGPGNPVFVSGQVLGDTPCASITDNAAVAAGPVAASLMTADATRLEAVIYNQGPDTVAIGPVGVTWANRVIVLSAGDTWIEQRGASLAWEVVTDAGDTASVSVQERNS
jgi:hypothetical protein